MLFKKIVRTALVPLALVAAIALTWRITAQDATSTSAADVMPAPTATATAPAPAPAPAATTEPAAARPQIVLAQADTASARQFTLGKEYERLSPTQPTSSGPDKIEVAEVFWYGCPHCYTFDPYLDSWKENLPADVSFVRIPALWNELLQVHARLYYTAEALNKLGEIHSATFREIHVNRKGLDNPAAIRSFFGGFGVDATTFDNTFESFAVHTKIQRADELARRYRVSSVPAVIVNGKYTTNATMAGSYPKLLEVINELVAMERAGE